MDLIEQNGKKVYSDGKEIESRLLEIAEKFPEDESEDYISNNSQYTINNTFSSVRKNLLNWYPFNKDSEILEIGAGAGSITGFLCDIGRNVVSLEMSKARSDIIKARYPNRKNLTVVNESIQTWNSTKKFDYVIFVGVLEYAAVFSDTENPYVEFLQSAKKHLKENGKLLFAIENKFGLKYWLGASEDYLQKPFVGIKGYIQKKTPQTFSKATLKDFCIKTGLRFTRFYSIYPDYKFPEIICSEEYNPNPYNLRKVNFTYGPNSTLYADERNLYQELEANNVYSFFANSYLIEASMNKLNDVYPIFISAKGEVKKEFRVNTVMYNNGKVLKIPVHKKATKHIQQIVNNTNTLIGRGVKLIPCKEKGGTLICDIYNGIEAEEYFVELLKNNDFNSICIFLKEYQSEIEKSSEITTENSIINELNDIDPNINFGKILKNGYIDLTFYNAFYENHSFIFYDQEWNFEYVPLLFILYYAIKSGYTRANVKTKITLSSLFNIFGITDVHQEIFNRLEEHIWKKVLYRVGDFYGEDGYCNRYDDRLTLDSQLESYKTDILNKDSHISQLIESERNLKGLLNNKEAHIELLLQGERNRDAQIRDRDAQIQDCNAQIRDRDAQIQECNAQIRDRDAQIQEYNAQIRDRDAQIQEYNVQICNQAAHIQQLIISERELKATIQAIYNSRSYRITAPLRIMAKPLKILYKSILPVNCRKAIRILRHEGIKSLIYKIKQKLINKAQLKKVAKKKLVIVSKTSYNTKKIPQFENPLVSIVIPVFNQFDYTYKCIVTILNTVNNIPFEIIIGDDKSTDQTKNIEKYFPGIKVNINKTDHGFLMNCNRAAKLAQGKYILFLNNDTQVQENWLSSLLTLIESDSKIGMVGSKLVYPDGRLQEAGGIIWNDASGWNYGRAQDPDMPEYNYIKEADYISGASIMIRKTLWEEIGGFDECFKPAYYEDSDLAFEVRKRGYKIMYQPASVVVHFEGISNGTDLNSGLKKYQVDNKQKFIQKWENELKKQYPPEPEKFLFKARDRSFNKPTILMIDHYVPTFDKDAGSRTLYQYLKLFVDKGYSVKLIGDNFFKSEPYTSIYEQMGIEVLVGPWYYENWKSWVISNKEHIKYIWLNRPHISIKYIDFFKNNTNAKIVYYNMDLHFVRLERQYEVTKNPQYLEESKEWKEKEFYLMKNVDMNYTISSAERDIINKMAPEIPIKVMGIFSYPKFRSNIPQDFTKRKNVMFVGGFTHTPNVDAVIWFVKEVFGKISKSLDIKFYIVGSNPPIEINQLASKDIIVKGFVDDDELQNLYDSCRLAIIPLRFGAGVKGKVIEAMYNGLPIITTSIGAEGIDGIEDIVEIENDADNFALKTEELYKNIERLKKMSDNGLSYVKTNFSVDSVWNRIKDEFSEN